MVRLVGIMRRHLGGQREDLVLQITSDFLWWCIDQVAWRFEMAANTDMLKCTGKVPTASILQRSFALSCALKSNVLV